MDITAAVAFENRAPLRIETVELSDPAPDEVLVKLAASGLCHTDLTVLDQLPIPFPAVLGHEGAGRIVAVGSAVKGLAVGDAVVTTFTSCGNCPNCVQGRPAQCYSFAQVNMFGGHRGDGSCTHCYHGKPIFGSFLGQSSLASHALVKARSAVRLPDGFPLALAAPLGCGIQTGAGGVLNTLKPEPGSSIAIFGAGAVGLSALMAAKAVGCTTLIVVDRSAERLRLAAELGATHTLVAGDDTVAQIRQITGGGARHALEAAGAAAAMSQAIDCVGPAATALLLGIAPGAKVTLDITAVQRNNTTVKLVTMTEAAPQAFIPRLVALHQAGLLPYERFVTFYDFADINQALDDARSGAAIKPIIRLP